MTGSKRLREEGDDDDERSLFFGGWGAQGRKGDGALKKTKSFCFFLAEEEDAASFGPRLAAAFRPRQKEMMATRCFAGKPHTCLLLLEMAEMRSLFFLRRWKEGGEEGGGQRAPASSPPPLFKTSPPPRPAASGTRRAAAGS